jgi:DnaJ-class molecular chaperone
MPQDRDLVDPDEDLIEEGFDEDEDQICSGCSGCGEGQYEGTSCYKCHGSGVEPVEKDDKP